MRAHTRRFLRLCSGIALSYGLLACDKGSDASDDDKDPPQAAEARPENAENAENADQTKRAPSEKDRGEASMQVAGVEWKADKASFRLAAPRLTINASATQINEGNVTRQELALQIDNYDGPGSYTTPITGSRFIGVGLDTAAAQAAAETKDDAKPTAVVSDALSQAKHLMLSNAEVVIESASETEIVGSFSWKPPSTSEAPEIRDGKFRALARPKK